MRALIQLVVFSLLTASFANADNLQNIEWGADPLEVMRQSESEPFSIDKEKNTGIINSVVYRDTSTAVDHVVLFKFENEELVEVSEFYDADTTKSEYFVDLFEEYSSRLSERYGAYDFSETYKNIPIENWSARLQAGNFSSRRGWFKQEISESLLNLSTRKVGSISLVITVSDVENTN